MLALFRTRLFKSSQSSQFYTLFVCKEASGKGMKRTGAQGPGSGGPKRPRGPGGYDEDGGGASQTFEEELMMMDDGNMGDERIDLDDLDDPLVQVKRWSRPAADPHFDPKQHSLAFHWVDIDVTSGPPLTENPCEGERIIGSKEPIVPIIRMYGSTKDGTSVLTYVHGFTSYFYVALPPSTNLNDNSRAKMRAYLDQKVSIRCFFSLKDAIPGDVHAISRLPPLSRSLLCHVLVCVISLADEGACEGG